MRYFKYTLFFIGLSIILIAQSAQARFSVEPSKIEGNMSAGATYENAFVVSNPRDTDFTVEVQWSDKTINPLTKNWLTFETTELLVPAKGSVKVPVKITLPDNAAGEYNARVIFSQKLDATAGNPIGIRYNYPIYIAVTGTEKYDFAVEDIQIANDENLTFTIKLFNKSNVHIRPSGTIAITAPDNDSVQYTVPFNEGGWGILPEESYPYTSKIKESFTLPDGTYSAKIVLEAGPEGMTKNWNKTISFTINGSKGTLLSQ